MAKNKNSYELWKDFEDNWSISDSDLKRIASIQQAILKKRDQKQEYLQKRESLEKQNRQQAGAQGYQHFSKLQANQEKLAKLGLHTSGASQRMERQSREESQNAQSSREADYDQETQSINSKINALKRDILGDESTIKYLETRYKKRK